MNVKNLKQFKDALRIKNEIIGVKFVKKSSFNSKHYRDTACTALARAIINKTEVIFDAKHLPQLCPGANYFFKFSKIKNSEVHDVYVKDERVFANKKTCALFLRKLPKFPDSLRGKSISIKPLANDKVDVVILMVTPAQCGRILGLLNSRSYKTVEVLPNQPTCLSLFAPLVTKKPHCNFIDYYDRYYQGVIHGKKIWAEDKMIISLLFSDFKEILNNLEKSPQGSFRPDLKPQKVDTFFKKV